MKTLGQKGKLIYVKLSNNKYEAHQGKRERARRLKRLIAHPEERSAFMNEGDLINTYLKLKE